MIAKVTIIGATRHFDQAYDYAVPDALRAAVRIGQIVSVPFANRKSPAKGYVTSLSDKAPDDTLKVIEAVLTSHPVVTAEQLRLAVEMRKRYFCSYSAALDCMLPPRVSLVGHKKTRVVRLKNAGETEAMLEEGAFRSQGHMRVAELLLQQEAIAWPEVKAAAEVSDAVLRTLMKNGVIESYQVEISRPQAEERLPERIIPPQLKPAQQSALDALVEAADSLESGRLSEFLLYGVTGSGKTEVYLQLADKVLADGRTVIVLVPEIALTPQMEWRIRSRFGADVAILHSRLTLTERFETWQRISRGEIKVVVGARSAVFAPLQNIGLIVLDEEHEGTYKSGLKPRYHAADIARLRCLMHDALLVLGSATPSVETFERTRDGRSVLLTLPERIGAAGRPGVRIVDMKAVWPESAHAVISPPLEHAIRDALSRQEQSMILINRRGHERITVCRACGQTLKCGACEVSLVQHVNPRRREDKRLFCHHCDRIYAKPAVCPFCQEAELEQIGYGTERVEEVLHEMFPDAGILRMDQDTTAGRHGHDAILQRFAAKQAMILLGTQMIAKGHDFPDATVVGILSADLLLNGDDFRAAERGFALILQASGRAGRAARPGTVLIQTYSPDDPLIRLAARHDYDAFLQKERAYRSRLAYPPFGHIGMAMFSGHDEDETKDAADRFYRLLAAARLRFPAYAQIQLFKPAAAPLSRLRNRYRFRLIAKAEQRQPLTELLALADDSMPKSRVTRALDLDPHGML